MYHTYKITKNNRGGSNLKQKWKMTLFVSLSMMMMAACGNSSTSSEESSNQSTNNAATENVEAKVEGTLIFTRHSLMQMQLS